MRKFLGVWNRLDDKCEYTVRYGFLFASPKEFWDWWFLNADNYDDEEYSERDYDCFELLKVIEYDDKYELEDVLKMNEVDDYEIVNW